MMASFDYHYQNALPIFFCQIISTNCLNILMREKNLNKKDNSQSILVAK
jgi:hypothetical protein